MTGLGFLGYQFFKSQDKSQNSFYIERAVSKQCGSPGGRDSKDPKKTPNDRIINTIAKAEFFRQCSDRYEHWKNGVYRLIDRAKGFLDGKAHYLEWDHLHNDLEVYGENRQHIGSLDPRTMQLYKGAVVGRKIPR